MATSLSPRKSPNGPTAGCDEDWMQQTERKTQRVLQVDNIMSDANLAKCHPQNDSPLFNLPVELRDQISGYATMPYEDPKHKYKRAAYYYRPSHTARQKTCFNLLLTCRRMWLENNRLPMVQAKHSFWFQRGPYDKEPDSGWEKNVLCELERYSAFVHSLHPTALCHVNHIHLFVQMFQAENLAHHNHSTGIAYSSYNSTLHEILQHRALALKPKTLQISIRHTDWWYWETDAPLRFNTDWIQALLNHPLMGGIGQFTLELETLKHKVEQLAPIVHQLLKLQGESILVEPFQPDCEEYTMFRCTASPYVSKWTGEAKSSGKPRDRFRGRDKLHYHIVEITWRAVPTETTEVTGCGYGPSLDAKTIAPTASRYKGPPGPPIRNRPAGVPPQQAGRRSLIGPGRMYLQANETLRALSAQMADAFRCWNEARLKSALAGMEVERLEQEWEARGSLLKFMA